ncbi:MAG: hypothetical protein FJ088_00775 [Deltaproteobacteria bacterium]|nr:hypothetical protein [Deltaproteobacteria bacterium]
MKRSPLSIFIIFVCFSVSYCGSGKEYTDIDAASETDSIGLSLAGAVKCGGEQCGVGQNVCCAQETQSEMKTYCGLSCKVGIIVNCDGPEDCAEDKICCAVGTNAVKLISLECMEESNCGFKFQPVCHDKNDCPEGKNCYPINEYTAPYGVCI